MIVRLRIPRRKTPDVFNRNRFSVRRSRADLSVHGYRNAFGQCFRQRHDHVIFERRFRRFPVFCIRNRKVILGGHDFLSAINRQIIGRTHP